MSAKTESFLQQLLEQKSIIKIMIPALTETISKYTQVPAVAEKPQLKIADSEAPLGVGGFICFEGQDLKLVLFLGFSKELFLMLYNNMFQGGEEEITKENCDLAGEILNIAFGIMDPKLRENGIKLRSSLPIIYAQDELSQVLKQINAESIAIPYVVGGKKFFVEIFSGESVEQKWHFDQKAS